MLRRKVKGVALITVIIVMAVMTILGTCILNVSVAEARQAALVDKRIQAQFLAKSGAEATLAIWKDAARLGNTLPVGESSPKYLNRNLISNTNEFSDTESSSNIGKFIVTVTNAPTTSVISSVGTVRGVSQTVTATINISSHTVSIPVAGSIQEMAGIWYENNGQVRNTTPPAAPSGVMAAVNPPSGNGILKFEHCNSIFEADIIDFKVDIWNFKEILTLKSNIIVCEQTIDFSHGGQIILRTNGSGFTRPGYTGSYGKLEYGGEWYWFKDGMVLTDPNTQLTPADRVAPADIPTLPGGFVLQPIKDYTIKWNNQ